MARVVFGVVWVIPALIATLLHLVVPAAPGRGLGLGAVIAWQSVAWGVWIVWSQLIITLVEKVQLAKGKYLRWTLVHATACALICLANVMALGALNRWLVTHTLGLDERGFAFAAANYFTFQLVLYWAVVGAAYMVEYLRKYRERDRLALQLEEKLAQMQLDALRMQLNPHFLFNALNSVSALMDIDVVKAQSMLARVSDLLRLSLKNAGSTTIPVWQEVELAELYLQVAQMRYGEGLKVDFEVDPHAVDEQVPSFIMQPLIENALKHGLQPGHPGQHVQVEVRKADGILELVVEDNGRGLEGQLTHSGRFLAMRPSVDGLGIGLTNTRARLTMLYGDSYAFRMSNNPLGGCRVEIRLPVEQ